MDMRPGSKALVKHFPDTGEVYGDHEVPKIGDEGYLPFVDEQITVLVALGDDMPWPTDAQLAWNSVAPTSLILLRGSDEPPARAGDPASGDEAEAGPEPL